MLSTACAVAIVSMVKSRFIAHIGISIMIITTGWSAGAMGCTTHANQIMWPILCSMCHAVRAIIS